MDGVMGVNSTTTKFKQELLNWCDQTWPRLYRFIYYRVQNRQEAEDFTQETYARVLNGVKSSRNLPSQNYLQTVALNLIRDRWRRQKSRGIEVPLEESLLSGSSQTEESIDREWLKWLMSQLAEDHQTVLRLRIIEGYSRAETARRMGRTEDAIRGLQYRAVLALRDMMKKDIRGVEKR